MIKITDYMQLSKEDRQKHIDLNAPCLFHYYKRDYKGNGVIKKTGDLYSKNEQMIKAKSALLGFLNIEDFSGNKVHVCHLCDCCSTSDKVCVNPLHLYFGTAKENAKDIPFEVKQKVGKIGGKIGGKAAIAKLTKEQRSEWASKGRKKAAQLGKTGAQQIVQCPHCSKEGNLINMKRWHFDNCKHKPTSVTSPNISNLIPESSSTNL